MNDSKHEFPNRASAPHMYILRAGGDAGLDEDYAYVGNLSARFTDPAHHQRFQIGITPDEELVCHMSPDVYKTLYGISVEDIPNEAKKALAREGLRVIGTHAGRVILGKLEIEIPFEVELVDYDKLLNGTPEEVEAEKQKNKKNELAAAKLRTILGV